MAKKSGIVAELRAAIREAKRRGVSRYAIAEKTGLSEAMLSLFMAGKSVPSLDSAEKIAKAIGKVLVLK